MEHVYFTPSSKAAQRSLWKGGQNSVRPETVGGYEETVCSEHAGQLHTGTHSGCDTVYKTYASLNQTKSHGGGAWYPMGEGPEIPCGRGTDNW